jgi:hypothetical protein
MDSIYSMIFGALFNNYETAEKVGRDTVGEYTIDTCYTIDQGWETAVWKGDHNMIIVGRYPDKESAQEGHADWCAACALNPTGAWSVQHDEYMTF